MKQVPFSIYCEKFPRNGDPSLAAIKSGEKVEGLTAGQWSHALSPTQIAKLSFTYFEQPLLRRGHTFKYQNWFQKPFHFL